MSHTCTHSQNTNARPLPASFPPKKVLPLDAPYTEPSTGIPQPPGGLMFALRCETGPPGNWGPVEAYWQVRVCVRVITRARRLF